MTMKAIIERTVQVLNQLPHEKVIEISDFAEFISKKHEEELLTNSLQKMVSESKTFAFLEEEEDLYSLSDLKLK